MAGGEAARTPSVAFGAAGDAGSVRRGSALVDRGLGRNHLHRPTGGSGSALSGGPEKIAPNPRRRPSGRALEPELGPRRAGSVMDLSRATAPPMGAVPIER